MAIKQLNSWNEEATKKSSWIVQSLDKMDIWICRKKDQGRVVEGRGAEGIIVNNQVEWSKTIQ